jgi:tetratricopeptide (TPR) repeat protein/S1-C subfamily serine protease
MSNPYVAWMSGLVVLCTSMPVLAISPTQSKPVGNGGIAQTAPEESIEQIARRVTVRIVTGQNAGSGTIISRRDNTYLILTNNHVVRGAQNIKVQTFDGQTYLAKLLPNAFITQQDLALLEITSTKTYRVPEIADFSPRVESETLSAGYEARSGKFQTSEGKVQQFPAQPLKEGYQLGYSGKVEQGMSGGPVFDGADYKLIGINARIAYPVDSSYLYEDGTSPSVSERQQMRQMNWGVPIQKILAEVQPAIATAYKLPRSSNNSDIKTVKFTGWLSTLESKTKQITVRIDNLSKQSNGSGVIIAKKGNIYTVLTANHVVCEKVLLNPDCQDFKYSVLTHDGQQYLVKPSLIYHRKDIDLAVLQFESNTAYPVATLANYSPQDRAYIFTAGYPQKSLSQKAEWLFSGGRIFNKEEGFISVTSYKLVDGVSFGLTQSTFIGGNDLVYTNLTFEGMSGGPVVDIQGRVIGIHSLAEGVVNTKKDKIQLGNSLGIPIGTALIVFKNIPEFNLSSESSLDSTAPQPLTPLQNSQLIKQIFPLISGCELRLSAKDLIDCGNQLRRIDQNGKSLKVLEQAIGIDRELDYLAYYGKSFVLSKQEKYPEAIKSLGSAISKKYDFFPAYLQLTRVYRKSGQHKKALDTIETIIERFKNENENPSLLFEKYLSLESLGRYSEALDAITQAIKLAPRAVFYSLRGASYTNLKQYENAIIDYDKAVQLNPLYAEIYANRGLTYFNLGKLEDAIVDYNKAIQLDPQNARTYNNRALTYNGQDLYEKRIADYSKAIKLDPKYTLAYFNRGNTYFILNQKYIMFQLNELVKNIDNIGDELRNPLYTANYKKSGNTYCDKASSDLTIAIKLNPLFAEAYNRRGTVYMDLNQTEKAFVDFNNAIAINPQYAEAYDSRGEAYYEIGNPSEGMKDLITADKLYKQQKDKFRLELLKSEMDLLKSDPATLKIKNACLSPTSEFPPWGDTK